MHLALVGFSKRSPWIITRLLFPQMDHDPRNPTYIASQGPLASTVADFWQVGLVCSSTFHLMCLQEEKKNKLLELQHDYTLCVFHSQCLKEFAN